jgi:hypothetical protein
MIILPVEAVGTGANANKVQVRMPGETSATADLPYAEVFGSMPTVGQSVLTIFDAMTRRVITGGAGTQAARKSADQNFTTATLANVTDMAIPVGASEVWAFRFNIFYRATTAADLRIAVAFPSSDTGHNYVVIGMGIGVTGQFSNPMQLQNIVTSGAGLVSVGGAGIAAGNELYAIVEGVLRNGVNAGNIQLQCSQSTADAANPSVVTAYSSYQATRM